MFKNSLDIPMMHPIPITFKNSLDIPIMHPIPNRGPQNTLHQNQTNGTRAPEQGNPFAICRPGTSCSYRSRATLSGRQRLYYTVLYYTILYYTILYYTMLYYTILYYTILYYTILYYTVCSTRHRTHLTGSLAWTSHRKHESR